MKILDELRDMVKRQREPNVHRGDIAGRAWNDALNEALAAINQFAADHPGLLDKTVVCEHCGAPWAGRIHLDGSADASAMRSAGWDWIETCDRITPDWTLEDNETWRVCPDCAKEAE